MIFTYLRVQMLDVIVNDLYQLAPTFTNSTVDNHRVFLKGQDPGRDYINAVFVNVSVCT